MKKNKKLLVLVALFLAVFAVGGTLAYLTDTTTEKTNTFTFGKVDIDISEPTWEGHLAADTNYGKKIAPGESFEKDPTITVKADSKDAYVFMEVTVPTGTVKGVENTPLFTYAIKDGWVEVEGAGSSAEGTITKVYAYGNASQMTKVAAEGEVVLFNEVTAAKDLKSTEVSALTGDQNIVVKGYAIQADGLGDTKDPGAVWTELQNSK